MNQRREQAWAKWRDLVSEQEQSGQSVAAFCRDRELAGSQFIYWKKRLREAGRAPFVEVQLAQHGVEPRVQAGALGSPQGIGITTTYKTRVALEKPCKKR
jgi:hypothetical protein